jgi:hypothetical protein
MTSRNFASIKLSSDFVDEARLEAEVLHRSLSGQIEYWARLGRAIEQVQGFSVARIRAVLEGQLDLDDLTAAEQGAAFDQLGSLFDNPPEDVLSRYAELGAREASHRAPSAAPRTGRSPRAQVRRAG